MYVPTHRTFLLAALAGVISAGAAAAQTRIGPADREALEDDDSEPAADGSAAPESRRTFTLDEARALMPRVQEITAEAVERYAKLPGDLEDARLEVVQECAEELKTLGVEIKGLWLVDFDSGAGYYCWKYPEPALNHFHSYEEGFAGRLPLT